MGVTQQDIVDAVGRYKDAFDSEGITDSDCFAELERRDELLDKYREYEIEHS